MVKVFINELRLYVCNHIVNKIPSHTIRLWFYRRIMGFDLAEGVAIHLGARFDCARGLKIGKNSVINENCRLDCRGGIAIGSNVSISAETIILTADHDPDSTEFAGRTRGVLIGDYVFIGTRAMLLPGVAMKRGAVAAAGSVVSKDVQACAVVAGVPARLIRQRNIDLDYQLSYRRWFH